MEFVIEHEEIDRLLRKALAAEGIEVPSEAEMAVRQNHKKGTVRVVFQTQQDKRGRKKDSGGVDENDLLGRS